MIRRETSTPVGNQAMPLHRHRRPSSRSRPPAPPPRPIAPKTRRKHRIRRWSRIIALMVLISPLFVSGGVVAGALWFDTSLHREPILTDYPNRPAAGRGSNWLLVGSDSRQGLTIEQQKDLTTGGDIGNGRTDTILLVHIPRLGSNRRATMVSIPRDSYVSIPDHGHDKINAAFAIGGGLLLTQTLEQVTGLRLDHYAEIGFSGFASLVNALGGTTVCLAAPVTDPLAGLDLPAGCQQLGGRNALGYVRTRATPRADLDRMVNQRQFLSRLLNRATSPAVWLNPWYWHSVPRASADALTVDHGDHVWDLAQLGWMLRESSTTLTVPIGEFTTNDAGSVVVWNHDAARELFDALASDAPVPTSTVDRP